MTVRIPDELLQQAWDLYLWDGETFEWISGKTGIPKTTVFNILEGQAKNHPDYSLMRSLAVNLRKHRWNPYKFATGIRIDTLLTKNDIDPIDGENLIQRLLAECFKAKWTPSEALTNLKRFTENAAIFGHSPYEHAKQVNKILHLLNDSNRKVEANREAIADLIHSKSVIEENLEIFSTRGGMVLSDAAERVAATELMEENKKLRKELESYRSGQIVDRGELEKLNKRLITPTTEEKILDISNDVRLNPSKYPGLFQTGIPLLNLKPFQGRSLIDKNEELYEQNGPTDPNGPPM